MIYLDNAATSKNKPREVVDAVLTALNSMGNASRGVYEDSILADKTIYRARKSLNEFFNGPGPKQLAFTKNSTEALNLAILGLIEEGDHIITSQMEHNSVLRPLNHLKATKNISIDYLDLDKRGNLSIDNFKGLIGYSTKALVLNHGSNVTGNIADIKAFGKICKDHGLIFILDASQTAGVFDIDMEKMNIDVVCFTGHKSLYGPQGTGGLCVSKDLQVKPTFHGGTGVQTYLDLQPSEMPTVLEAGTLNSHGIAGLLAGLDYIKDHGMDKLRKRSQNLAKLFYDGIKDLGNLVFYGDYRDFSKKAPIVSLNIGKLDSSYVSMVLSEDYKISTRPGAHCAPLLHKSFKTVNQGMVRFSFSHLNTEKEVHLAIKAIEKISQEHC